MKNVNLLVRGLADAFGYIIRWTWPMLALVILLSLCGRGGEVGPSSLPAGSGASEPSSSFSASSSEGRVLVEPGFYAHYYEDNEGGHCPLSWKREVASSTWGTKRKGVNGIVYILLDDGGTICP